MRFVALIAALGLSAAVQAAPVSFTKDSGTISWKGSKRIGDAHTGTLDLKKGSLDLEGKKGEFVIDMNSIKPTDSTPDKNGKLADHLKSPDFFEVAKHNEAKLVIKDIAKDASKADQYTVTGDLTVRGITKPIKIPATIAVNGKKVSIDSNFKFDRTEFGVNYGADGKQGGNVGKLAADKIIENDVDVTLKLSSN